MIDGKITGRIFGRDGQKNRSKHGGSSTSLDSSEHKRCINPNVSAHSTKESYHFVILRIIEWYFMYRLVESAFINYCTEIV